MRGGDATDREGGLLMAERKPRGMGFETWIDRQIREAQERGEFDNLPGAGKPLPGYGRPDDEDWWVKQWIRRENITGVLPASLKLRREIEDIAQTVAAKKTEAAVRKVVDDL